MMFGTKHSLFWGGTHLKFYPRVPPTCIIYLASKNHVVYLRYVASSLGFRVIVWGVLWDFYKQQLLTIYTLCNTYVRLILFFKVMPDVPCSKILTLILQSRLSEFVFVIRCYNVFLYQHLFCNEV